MRCRVEHLVVVAGPTASGKSTLIREILANRLPEVGMRIGIEDLQEWPCIYAHPITELTEQTFEGLILHYDFLWSPYRRNAKPHDGDRALSLLEGAREVSFVTLWTPPARLERHLIEGKLQTPLKNNVAQHVKSVILRFLPRFLIVWMARLPLFGNLGWWSLRSPFKHHLNLLEIYSQPGQVVRIYRRWFQFCDRQISKTRSHLIVEFDEELKFYSRDEWENMIHSYESSAEAPGSSIAYST